MNSISFGRNLRRAGLLIAALASAAGAAGQFVPTPVNWGSMNAKENWISLSGGAVNVSGSEATYQQLRQHHKDSFVGVDAFRWTRTTENDRMFTVNGRAIANDNEYLLMARYDNTATGSYVEAGFRESRVFYDSTGGYLSTNDQWLVPFDPAQAVDRGEFWLEAGIIQAKWSTILRFAHQYREGQKGSTSWSDTNLTGLTGSTAARYIVPAFYDLDETRDIVVIDADYHPSDKSTIGGGVRMENIETDNARQIRRRPGEPAADRYLTHRDATDADLFAVHAFGEHRPNEKLLLTAAAAQTNIDTNFTGSRIYGASYDSEFDPVFANRQQRDEGYYDLVGDSQWDQLLLTANALYTPAKNWRISGGLRYENQTQDVASEFLETAVGTTAARITAVEELGGDSSRDFDELLGAAEVSYTGMKNVVWSVFGEAASGDGDLREELVELENGVVDIARDTAYDRTYSKYGINARWYPATAVNFAVGAFHKTRDNDYDTSDDSTPNNGADRYPAYIQWQRIGTDDVYVRGTWRPVSNFSIVGRYDYTQSEIDSREDGLNGVLSSENTAHIMSGTVNWSPTTSLVVQGQINYVYDTVVTGSATSNLPIARQAGYFDNNYRTGSLTVFWALNDKTDVQADATMFQSNNYYDVSTISVPYGLTARDRSYGLSLNRRVNEDLLLGVRYARSDYSDATSGGNRDFTADMLYGRMQLRF